MKISVIIPTLNEAENLSVLIPHILKNSTEDQLVEIIISDGGSKDNTESLFNKTSKTLFLSGKRGRACQMNKGAEKATGEILYFLHADSFPPANFDSQIINAVEQGEEAGCFRLKFDYNHHFLRLSQWFTQWNFPIFRGGDQSLFITKALFTQMDGFNENYVIYEDNELTSRLYKQASFTVLSDYVLTSARKYRKIGVYKLQYHFSMIHLKKIMGASPQKLYEYYKKNIARQV
jgi:rSAM/selenodomain-associated transferase 2